MNAKVSSTVDDWFGEAKIKQKCQRGNKVKIVVYFMKEIARDNFLAGYLLSFEVPVMYFQRKKKKKKKKKKTSKKVLFNKQQLYNKHSRKGFYFNPSNEPPYKLSWCEIMTFHLFIKYLFAE